jgi:probable rRNA maturation factor
MPDSDEPDGPYLIEIADQQHCLELNEELLRDAVQHVLAAEQVRRAEISVALVDNRTIRPLNRQYLGHDYDTDVLSFLLDAYPEELPSAGPRGAGREIEGEVIVSVEMASSTALDYHWSPHDEVLLYLVHGLLHLCGYDDLSEGEQRVMRAREREILLHWNLTPHYAAEDEAAAGEGESARREVGADS